MRYHSRKLDFEGENNEVKSSSILAQSFVRYYFLEGTVRPIVCAAIGIGSSSFDRDSNEVDFDEDKESLFGYEAGTGVAFLFSKIFSVDFSVEYNYLKSNPEDSDFEVETSGIVSAIGFSIYF